LGIIAIGIGGQLLRNSNVSLREILEIENDETITRFQCPYTGHLLWPLIRYTFINSIIWDFFYGGKYSSYFLSSRPKKAFGYVFKACCHNWLKASSLKGPILISAFGDHVLNNGKYFNRLADFFVSVAPDETVVQESIRIPECHWYSPRHNERVFFDALFSGTCYVAGRYFAEEKHNRISEELIEFVENRAKRILGWELQEEERFFLISLLAEKMATMPVKLRYYRKIFQRVGAKLFICQCGCYGGEASLKISAAHELGIASAEYQHGIIHSGHSAYNFADALLSSASFRETLPRYFLGYGKWWMDQINAPISKIVVGNPYRTEKLAKQSSENPVRRDFLILGDGIETEKYLSICSLLGEKIGLQYRVVFRPHPSEIEATSEKYGHCKGNVAIEWEKDVYEAFKTTECLMSETSTGLFEAIGLVNRIFLWSTPKSSFCFTKHPFAPFSDVHDLIDKVRDGESGKLGLSTAEEFWAPNWKRNYRTFLLDACPEFSTFLKTPEHSLFLT